jgi:hypothetical protein
MGLPMGSLAIQRLLRLIKVPRGETKGYLD